MKNSFSAAPVLPSRQQLRLVDVLLTSSHYHLGFLVDNSARIGPAEPEREALLCDPLTGLVAFPSFQSCLVREFARLAVDGLHLAIGDVDNLRTYVTKRRRDDAEMFGHLAGNYCMRETGAITLAWAGDRLGSWPFALCGTFGGDEVIVAASGQPYSEFMAAIWDLKKRLAEHAPCTSSFAVGTSRPCDVGVVSGHAAFRRVVSCVDRALFDQKEALREASIEPRGELVDVGVVEIAPASDAG